MAQAVPQAPQFAVLVWRFTQAPPQADCPVGHARWHIPMVQVSPVAQAVPQAPQFVALV
jgi:hypothetical protein